jgi:hypothetical protein
MDHIKDQGYHHGEMPPIGPELDDEAPQDRNRLASDRPAHSR